MGRNPKNWDARPRFPQIFFTAFPRFSQRKRSRAGLRSIYRSQMHKTSTLAELRAKTDRELVALVDQQLDLALRLAEGCPDATASRDQRALAKRSKAERV